MLSPLLKTASLCTSRACLLFPEQMLKKTVLAAGGGGAGAAEKQHKDWRGRSRSSGTALHSPSEAWGSHSTTAVFKMSTIHSCGNSINDLTYVSERSGTV